MKLKQTIIGLMLAASMPVAAQVPVTVTGFVSNAGGQILAVNITSGAGTLPVTNVVVNTNSSGYFYSFFVMNSSQGSLIATITDCDSNLVSTTAFFSPPSDSLFLVLNYCSNQLDCLGVPNGSALPGTVCTDSTGSTGIWDANCNCVVQGGQVDCLGVLGGSALPGTACTDSSGTGIWDQNCNCIIQGNQVDCLGVLGGSALPGTACTDSSGFAGIWDLNCNCITQGNQVDCLGVLGGSALPGTVCTDPSGSTGIWDANCNCIIQGNQVDCLGVLGGSALPGTVCTDSSGFVGVWDLNCNCAGQGGQVDCLGIVGGTALPGTACVDSSGNVIGTWDQNCNCVNSGNSIQEFQGSLNELILSPNPVSTTLNVSIESVSRGEGRIEIYALTGKRVMFSALTLNSGQNKTEVSTADLEDGMYIVKVVHNGSMITKRFVKVMR